MSRRKLTRSVGLRSARTVNVHGRHAYVGDLEWLRVFDVSDPSALEEVGAYQTPASIGRATVMDGAAYLAAYEAGLVIVGFDPPSQ